MRVCAGYRGRYPIPGTVKEIGEMSGTILFVWLWDTGGFLIAECGMRNAERGVPVFGLRFSIAATRARNCGMGEMRRMGAWARRPHGRSRWALGWRRRGGKQEEKRYNLVNCPGWGTFTPTLTPGGVRKGGSGHMTWANIDICHLTYCSSKASFSYCLSSLLSVRFHFSSR